MTRYVKAPSSRRSCFQSKKNSESTIWFVIWSNVRLFWINNTFSICFKLVFYVMRFVIPLHPSLRSWFIHCIQDLLTISCRNILLGALLTHDPPPDPVWHWAETASCCTRSWYMTTNCVLVSSHEHNHHLDKYLTETVRCWTEVASLALKLLVSVAFSV